MLEKVVISDPVLTHPMAKPNFRTYATGYIDIIA